MTGKMVYATCLSLTLIMVWSAYILETDTLEMKQNQNSNVTTYSITVLTTASSAVCDKEFLSVTIDTNAVRRNWSGFGLSSSKVQSLANALAPIDLRFGGSLADSLIFNPNVTATEEKKQAGKVSASTSANNSLPQQAQENFTMTGAQWDALTTFVKTVGWNLIFDFNVFLRSNGVWDPSNADLFLNYSAARHVQYIAFQLGNEPDLYERHFNVSITPSNLAADFKILRTLISKYSQYKSSYLLGPGVTNLGVRSRSMTYLRKFIEANGADIVDKIGIHHCDLIGQNSVNIMEHTMSFCNQLRTQCGPGVFTNYTRLIRCVKSCYYMNAAIATVQQFLNVTKLESLKTVLGVAFNLTRVVHHPVRIILSETSSCFGGGAPNMSDSYVAGFLWLDKLGIASQYGLSRVFRQTFIGGSYELVSYRTFNPNPDFYLSLLFKRLVEGPVFPVTSMPVSGQVRVYANCARKDFFKYPAGALVLYYLNLADQKAVLSLTQFSNEDREVFSLTPGDSNGLQSRFVKLNGEILLMPGDDIPPLLPSHQHGDITLEAQSFGFIVIPQANVPACTRFYANTSSTSSLVVMFAHSFLTCVLHLLLIQMLLYATVSSCSVSSV